MSTRAEKRYQKIIRLPRPEPEDVMCRHPRMAPEERAKIFAPFSALNGYDKKIEEASACARESAHAQETAHGQESAHGKVSL